MPSKVRWAGVMLRNSGRIRKIQRAMADLGGVATMDEKLKGYRTVLYNGLLVIASIAAIYGIDIDAKTQAEVIAGVFALVNVVQRFRTTTPFGERE